MHLLRGCSSIARSYFGPSQTPPLPPMIICDHLGNPLPPMWSFVIIWVTPPPPPRDKVWSFNPPPWVGGWKWMTPKMGWGRWMTQKMWYPLFVVGVDIRPWEWGGGVEMDGWHPPPLGSCDHLWSFRGPPPSPLRSFVIIWKTPSLPVGRSRDIWTAPNHKINL